MKSIITFLLLSLVVTVAMAQVMPTPVISFSFTDGNLVEDNGKDFDTIGASATVIDHEYFGKVLELKDKADGLTVDADLINDTSFTISLWVSDSSNKWWNRYICIGGQDAAQQRSYNIGKQQNNNAQMFADVHSVWNSRFISSGLDLDTYEWFHMTVVYQKPTFTFYVNGDSLGSLVTDVPIVTADSIFLGLHAKHDFTYNVDNSLKGFMDEIRIYDTVLSSNEVHTLYTETMQGIKLSTKQATYKIDDSVQVKVIPEHIAVDEIEYISLDETVVSVEGAKLTALKGDTVNIVGRWMLDTNVVDTFEVIVLADTIVTLSAPANYLVVGDSLQMEVSIAPNVDVKYDWTVTSLGGTATIDTNGMLKASAKGNVQVKVTKQGSDISDSIVIKLIEYGANMLYADYSFDVDGSDAMDHADLQFFNNVTIVNDAERGLVAHINEVDTSFMAAKEPLIFDQDSFTFAAWYYYDQVNIDKNYRWSTIFEFNKASNKAHHYYFSPRLWDNDYGFISNGGPVGGSWTNVSKQPHYPTNTWYHIAVTQLNDTVTVYLNGNEYLKKSTGLNPSAFEVDTFFIGSNPLRDHKPMNAMFDDMKFYHKALSAEEIESLAGTIKPMEITVDIDSVDLDSTPTVMATVLPENATDKSVTWSVSSLTGEAEIDENTGVLTPTKGGFVKVYATAAADTNIIGEKVVLIYKSVESITLSTDAAGDSVEIDSSIQMMADIDPDNAVDKTVQWSVDNTSIATINVTTGVLTGVASGTVTVTATNAASGVQGTMEVKVYERPNSLRNILGPNSIAVSPNPSSAGFDVRFNTAISNTRVTVQDITGSVIYSQEVTSDQLHIPADAFKASGVYFLKVSGDSGYLLQKIIRN